MFTIEAIEKSLKEGRLTDAIEAASRIIAEDGKNERAYFLRGKAYWRLGERSHAIADYKEAVELNPASPASAALEHARDIMDFYNPDLMNP